MTADLFKKLQEPFPLEAHKWRIGQTSRDGTKALALCYIDARDVQNRLDDVVGPENWQTEIIETAHGRVLCKLSIRVDGEWVSKMDGAGDTGYEGEKGAISDALKRAAVQWGIGRYLYDLPSPWVSIQNKRIVDAERKRLMNMLAQHLGLSPSASTSQHHVPAQDHEALFNMAVEAMNKATDEASLKQAWKHIYKSVLPYVPEDMKAQLVSFKDKRKIDLGIEGQHEPHPIEAG